MSDPTPESSGMAGEESASAAATENNSPLTSADILVEQSDREAESLFTTESGEMAAQPGTVGSAENESALTIADVLLGVETECNLGAYLTIETIDGSTQVTIGTNAGPTGTAITIVTLENITDVTLAQLLNSAPTT